MSNSYIKAAFRLLMSPSDAVMLRTVEKAVDLLDTDGDDDDLQTAFHGLGVDFMALFPAKGPNHFGSFLELFDDPIFPCFDCRIDIAEPNAEGLYEVTFSGDEFGVEPVARLIFAACKSALPCAFEWSHGRDSLRVGEVGGGCVVITAKGIEHHSTRDILDRAIIREIGDPDEAVDGYVLAIRDAEHGLSFWSTGHGFGRLALATVFSEDAAARFDKAIAHDEPEWLTMPAPLSYRS